MKAYVRKLKNGLFYIIVGLPENHVNNTSIDEVFLTRRQAIQYIKKHGYELILREPKAAVNND